MMWLVPVFMAVCLGSTAAQPSAPKANLRGKSEVEEAVKKPDLEQCGVVGNGKGRQAEPSTTRIVHGKDAGQCVWRWQVSLGSKSGSFCGGTLIAPDWVLTAAHCIKHVKSTCEVRNLRIGAGKWERERVEDNEDYVERRVRKIYKHPLHEDNVARDYDFALLKLDKKVPISECIGVACLPGSISEPGTDCRITGWGRLVLDGPTAEVLQEAPVKLLANNECETNYTKHDFVITGSMLCATGMSEQGITDACQGDSGGPLVCSEDGRFVLRGVTSWGLDCAYPGYPGVYGRVTSVLSWIEDVTHEKVSKAHAEDVQEQETPEHSDVEFNGAMWKVTSGNCTMDEEGCIMSPNYPDRYGSSESCEIAVNTPAAVPIRVANFSTEQGFDRVVIDCESFSGQNGPQGVIPATAITWSTDDTVTRTGWKFCPDRP